MRKSDGRDLLTRIEGAQGVNFSASYFATPLIMPFLRGGISEGDVALYDKSLTAGVGYFGLLNDKNTLGFALNWSEVSEDLLGEFGVKQTDQITSEIYYNIAVNEFIQITPDLQYIKDPAFSNESSTWVIGLRARVII
ncbi:carbohydrate porin [Aliivibrio sp. SR45-2]|nr:carbohydrate porin [Aliivibrio sp. SR45-2]